MKTILKEYRPIENSEKQLMIEVYYHLGGMNYWNYKQEPRGYYASVTPVKINKHDGYTSMEFGMGHGTKRLLLETKRKSDKAAKEAISLFTEELKNDLCDHVLGKESKRNARLTVEAKIKIALPPRVEGLTEAQIMDLPVVVVRNVNNHFETLQYKDLTTALQLVPDLKTLCGAMWDRDGLRFEDQEANNVLSN